ncbi:MAG: ATP-binding cassette domain-containing protein [Verrucomicrobiota bacterium]
MISTAASLGSPVTDAVSCQELSFRYGAHWVLEGLSFSIANGESIGIIGPNGGGKSTLLKLLLGLLVPQEGTLSVLGSSPVENRRRIGYVPQAIRFDPLFPISVLDIVLMGRLDRLRWGRHSSACRDVALQSLVEVNLAPEANTPFSDLSGGQRQRVLIARALACQPDLLLLDEPTANIDLSVEKQFLDTLLRLRETMTIIVVSHDLDIVSRLGDSVLCVNHRIHRHSLPLSGEAIREIYSGSQRLVHERRSHSPEEAAS